MSEPTLIEVASDFSRAPGGRFEKNGPHSGEEFRRAFLVPALRAAKINNGLVAVRLDGAAGYAGSFLEEAFGGLIRLEGYTKDEIHVLLEIRTDSPRYKAYVDLAWQYIDEARPDKVH